ncbi:MAG: PAS domain S-box protein, partial [Methanobacteriota archaeon]
MQRDDKKYEASQFFWLIDELDYGVVLVDKDLQILWLNHAMEDLFSIERDAARGMDIMHFIRETVAPRIDDPMEFCDKVASSIAAGISVKNVERRLSGSQDNPLWIEYSSQIVENGPFKGMRMDIYQNISLRKQLEQELSRHFGHLGEMIEERTRELTKVNEQLQREINDRKRVEEELSKERDFSSNLVRGSPAFFVALNPDRGVIMMNDSMLNALGYQGTEVAGKEYATTFVPEPDRASVAQFFSDVASRASFVHEHHLSAKDGRYLLVEWHGRPVCKDDGSLDYYFAVGIDITERKRVETALAESEALYRTIFETTGSATIIINEDTTIALANTEFERLFGYQETESTGRSWIELVQKGDIERMKEYHRLRRIDPDLAPRNYEFHLIDRQGAVRDVAMTIAMIPGTGRSVASLIDITERKKAEEEVRQHNRYLSAINQIIEAATSTETLDDFLACALEKTIALLEFDAGAVYVVDAQHKTAAI